MRSDLVDVVHLAHLPTQRAPRVHIVTLFFLDYDLPAKELHAMKHGTVAIASSSSAMSPLHMCISFGTIYVAHIVSGSVCLIGVGVSNLLYIYNIYYV